MFSCQKVEMDFIYEAPLSFENVIEVDASPQAVFELLADVDSWPKWFSGMTGVKWLTEGPHDVGSRRQVTLAGMIKVSETFLAWEPGKRFTFRFDSQNAILAKAAVEDIQLEALPKGRCKVTYTVHMALPAPMSVAPFLVKPVLATIFKRGAKGLKKYLKAD